MGVYQLFDIELWCYGFGDKQWMGGQIFKYIVGFGKFWCYLLVGGFCLQFDGLVMEVVGELYVNDVDFVEQFIGNYLLCLLDYLIVGIVVGNVDDFVLFFVQIYQFVCFFGGKVEGFFVDNVEFCFQCCFGDGEMGIVWGGD